MLNFRFSKFIFYISVGATMSLFLDYAGNKNG